MNWFLFIFVIALNVGVYIESGFFTGLAFSFAFAYISINESALMKVRDAVENIKL